MPMASWLGHHFLRSGHSALQGAHPSGHRTSPTPMWFGDSPVPSRTLSASSGDHLLPGVPFVKTKQAYNEVHCARSASLITAISRMAAHTGQEITATKMLACNHEFAPDVNRLTFESPGSAFATGRGQQISSPTTRH